MTELHTTTQETSANKDITDNDVYEELLRRSGGKFTGDIAAIHNFEPIYRKLHTLGLKLGHAYLEVADQFGYSPGNVNVVLGGGRAKGKPFKEDSDLDIFFYIENPKDSIASIPYERYPQDPLNAVDERIIKQQALLQRVSSICADEGVKNEFHVLGFGSAIPQQYSEESEILLAIAKPLEK